MQEKFARFIIKNRLVVVALIVVITAIFGYKILDVEFGSKTIDLFPYDHPYVETFVKYADVFGGANTAVLAVEVKGGASTSVGQGETINGDLFTWGGAITINGTVNGDVFAAGGSLAVNGTVNGSVTAAAGTINVKGEVTRSLRVACGLININGSVGGDVMLLGRNLVVGEWGTVGGNLQMVLREAELKGVVAGKVSGPVTRLTISGLVLGDIDVSVDTLIIESTAEIDGDIYYASPNEIQIEPGAEILGTLTQRPPEPVGELTRPPSVLTLFRDRAITYAMALLVGVVLLFLLPRRMNGASEAIRQKPWASLGWGALLVLVVPVVVAAVAATIIGIPLALIVLALYGITLYLTQLPVSLIIGQLIFERFRLVQSRGMQVASLALGLAIVELIRSLPIPYWGWIITAIVMFFGMGAILVSERRLVEHGR